MEGPVEVPYPQYRCGVCGEDLPLNDARMTVTCPTHRLHGGELAVRDEIRLRRPVCAQVPER